MIEDFKDKHSHANLSLISKQLLMPFFQIRTRILERRQYFKIGDIEFYVAAIEPHDSGKVTARTNIRCTNSVSKSENIERINLAPLRRLDTSRSILMDSLIKPYFKANMGMCVHKNQILDIGDHEFYIRYSRPFFGRVCSGTEVKIES